MGGGVGGLLRARSNWRHAVAVTLPIIGESNKIKYSKSVADPDLQIGGGGEAGLKKNLFFGPSGFSLV